MKLGLEKKVALVTGASKGIGLAIAEGLAAEGATVVVSARGQDDIERATAGIRRRGGEALGIAADVTKAADVERLVAAAVEHFGTVHVLVNNAGGVGAFSPFDQLSDDDWMAVYELNVVSAVRVTRAVLPHMRRQGWGRIINISSESGIQPDPFMPHYNASKAALNNLTKSLSKAYATDGILVNTVSPAFILTPLVNDLLASQAAERGISRAQAEKDFLATNRPHIELKRAGRSEEVATAVVYLASEAASFITGANLRVDGGSVASV